MNRHIGSLTPRYFTELYASDPDPWRFATSPYEHAKYDATLASLPRATYAQALEIGCSIGVLTRRLASRCTSLLSVDVAESALDAARERCADLPHVRFAQGAVPAHWPEGRFDLIVLSEVVYYLGRDDIAALVGHLRTALNPGGDLVLVHWTGDTHYPLSGDEAAEAVIALGADSLAIRHQGRTPLYRLDVLRAVGSVAAP
ncbi:methyltransferase domain-containing protein [Methylobacterium sp. BTF04]|uniref:class I SAM-dependent DNA methyltransferase n=1 Tax=Methylobacterium sp. BTF04 TaxID=2708300 RepID=UPI0013D0A05C|nr:SAM-dependent methyltransferase [Methylobacterium sp. BTF04]NEU12860.1 methyltransferase domain-containing protein [Methylobacterium sp. BTF04]